jgi:alcohol dehydrogenase class IV
MSPLHSLVRPFVSPARVLSGPGSASAVGAELAAAGIRPEHGTLLVVADAAVLDFGLTEPALLSLAEAGFTVDVRPPITGEPKPETVRELAPADSAERVAAVVAIGGGSALDAAKLAALSVTNELDLTAGLQITAEVNPGVPVLAVPTTAGTGAEATAVAMLWHNGSKKMFVHSQLVPRLAVLDPDLLSRLPPSVTAAGGLDAISHAVESLLSTFRTPLSERAALSALALLADGVPESFSTGAPGARYATLLGAYQAGLALNASVVLGHSLAYVVAGRANLSHGVSCAMTLPYAVAHCRAAREAEIAEIAGVVCGEANADLLVPWLVDANNLMGIPSSLAAVGIGHESLTSMAEECRSSYPRPNHPVPIDADSLEQVLTHFLHGDAIGAWQNFGPNRKLERSHA